MASQYFKGIFSHKLSNSSITDLTMPTFVGITSLVANANGSLSINASPATDTSTPVKYEIYIATTSTGLFNLSNVAFIVSSLPCTAFQDSSGNILSAQLYYVGIRAVDSVGNRNTNTINLSVTSAGVPDTSTYNLLNTLVNTVGAPDLATVSADILAIKNKTNQISFTSGNINSIAVVVSDKTGYALTSGERIAIATAVEAALINDTDGQALISAIVAAIGNINVDEVALVAAIRSDIERSGGMLEKTKLNTSLIPALI